MTGPRQITISTVDDAGYFEVTAAIRTRADDLHMSRAMIEVAAGLPEHNASKLLSPVPDKRMMAETMLRMLNAVEFDIVLIPRPGAARRVADLHGQRQDSHVRTNNKRTALRIANKARRSRLFNDPNYFKKIGRAGGRARAKQMPKSERSKLASKASNVRWKREKARRRSSRCAPTSPPQVSNAGGA